MEAALILIGLALYLGPPLLIVLCRRRREPDYKHGEPHSAIAVMSWAVEKVIADGTCIPTKPGTVLIAVINAEGRPVREILVTLDE